MRRPAKATAKNATAGVRTTPAATAIRWNGGTETMALLAVTLQPMFGCQSATARACALEPACDCSSFTSLPVVFLYQGTKAALMSL